MLQLSSVDLAAVTGGAKAKGGGSLIEATHLEPVSYAPPPANHGLDLAAQLGLGGGAGSGKHSK
ncbi:MAG: hypothetical protein ABJE66_23810 [Deltaproteobacteria bacterium]